MPTKSLFDDPGNWQTRSEEMRTLADNMQNPVQNPETKAAFLRLAGSP